MAVSDIVKATLARVLPESAYLSLVARNAVRSIATRRRWAPEIEFLPLYVAPGDTVIDVGANQGLYTYHLSRIVGGSGKVHVFEPLPPNVKVLRHTISAFGLQNVVVHPVACGAEAGHEQFAIPSYSGVPHFAHARQGGLGQHFDCEIVRLDDVVQERITFLKVDVEGAELFVLKGAERTLHESRPTVLFEAAGHSAEFRYEQDAVFDFLGARGYKFYRGGFADCKPEPCDRFVEPCDYFAVAD